MKTQTHSKSKSRTPSKPMDVFEKLKSDHREVEKIFKKLMNSDEWETNMREEDFLTLKNLLSAHAEAEEKLFYPITETADPTADLTLEAYEEHKIAKTFLEELSELEVSDPVWMAKITVLSEVVNHHVKEEEGELFPKAKKLISKNQSKELGEEVEEFEECELFASAG